MLRCTISRVTKMRMAAVAYKQTPSCTRFFRSATAFKQYEDYISKQTFNKYQDHRSTPETAPQRPPFAKNIYQPHPQLETDFSEVEIQTFLKENQIVFTDLSPETLQNLPKPIKDIHHIDHLLPTNVTNYLHRNFTNPTPIQSVAWPIALSGLDLIAISRTGSGKTLGFLIPAITHVLAQTHPENMHPRALIVTPTRELALQIEKQFRDLHSGLKSATLIGGKSRSPQLNAIQRGLDVVIGTPGRINDLVDAGDLSLDNVSYAVLDEADTMLDMGFKWQIDSILRNVRPDKQMQLWSATWPAGVREIAEEFCPEAVRVNVGSDKLRCNPDVAQNFILLDDMEDRMENMVEFIRDKLENEDRPKFLVFTNTKAEADRIRRHLGSVLQAQVMSVHGGKMQKERDRVMEAFSRSRGPPVMVATEVAARGLDMRKVGYVINMELPLQYESYVHRIGRTGRAGDKGVALTYYGRRDGRRMKEFVEGMEDVGQEVSIEMRETMVMRDNRSSSYGGGRSKFSDSSWKPRRSSEYSYRKSSWDQGGSRSRSRW